jgi:hypothetical protein
VEAAQAGAYGNRIEASTAPAAAPTKPESVDVTVSATDRYENVKVGDLAGLLGTPAASGSEPGILLVADAPAGASDPNLGVVPQDAVGGEWTLTGAGAKAVKLAPRSPAAPFDPDDVLVRIAAGDQAGTFTLIVIWSATAEDVVPAGFAAAFSPKFDFLVTIATPAGGQFQTPLAGTVTLTGGHEPVAATTAKATVPADD